MVFTYLNSKMRRISIVTIILLFPILSYGGSDTLKVAIIVNEFNPTDDVSFEELVNILKQEKQYWKSGKKIYLIMQESGSLEKEIVLKEIFKMNEKQLKKFWLTKMFRRKVSSFPKTLRSNEAVKRFVSKVPNAIGYIDASLVNESVKVLRIDGKLPKDEGYKLTEVLEYED